jgi:hypothetical protein
VAGFDPSGTARSRDVAARNRRIAAPPNARLLTFCPLREDLEPSRESEILTGSSKGQKVVGLDPRGTARSRYVAVRNRRIAAPPNAGF